MTTQKVALFIPNLALLKHFRHLLQFANDGHLHLVIFYYQPKNRNVAKESNIAIRNLEFVRVKEKHLLPSSKLRESFKVLNFTKNFLYWNQEANKEYIDLATRFGLDGKYSAELNTSHRTILETFLATIDQTTVDKSLKLLSSRIQNFTPRRSKFSKMLQSRAVDLLLISPYLEGDWQPIAANNISRFKNIPTALYMASWDNFETKGVALPETDYYAVWTNYHKDVLVREHFAKENRVFVIGSNIMNGWARYAEIQRNKTIESDEVSISILYLASSSFISRRLEIEILAEIVREMQKSTTQKVKLIIRCHPQVPMDLRPIMNIVENSKHIHLEVDSSATLDWYSEAGKENFVRLVLQADLVVGINTTLMLEACVLGAPVVVIETDGFKISLPRTKHLTFLKLFATESAKSAEELIGIFHKCKTEAFIQKSCTLTKKLRDELNPSNLSFENNIKNVLSKMIATQKFLIVQSNLDEKRVLTFVNILKIRIFMSNFIRKLKKAQVLLRDEGLDSFIGTLKHLDSRRLNRRMLLSAHETASSKLKISDFKNSPVYQILSPPRDKPSPKNELAYVDFLNDRYESFIKLVSKHDKIVFGPWFSELGFELLYLLPFINKIRSDVAGLEVSVITRGGPNPLYTAIGVEEVNALEFFQKSNWDLLTQQNWLITGGLKQSSVTVIDTQILAEISKEFSLCEKDKKALIVHPSWIFYLFRPYWNMDFSLDSILPLLKFPLAISSKTNSNSIFVKLYSRPSLTNSRKAQSFLRNLCYDNPQIQFRVVSSQSYTDDHPIFNLFEELPNFHPIKAGEYVSNLSSQFSEILNCNLSVLTYGGLSYFPLYYGRSCIAVFDDKNKFSEKHLEVANHLASLTRTSLNLVDLTVAENEVSSICKQILLRENYDIS